jgi:2-keto-4-pentenoate hydratase
MMRPMTSSDLTLNPAAIAAAAHTLATRRLSGLVGAALPAACRPVTLRDAWEVQNAVTQVLAQRAGEQVVGWKCGLPGADTWVLAPLYASTLYRSEAAGAPAIACPVWTQQGQVKVEPELAFVLGRDLPWRVQPYGADEVKAAVGAAHLALELIDQRYDGGVPLQFADRLADGLVNQGLYLGDEVDLARARTAQTMHIEMVVDQQPLLSQQGAHSAGDPLAPLCWLAEFLRSQGQGLQAGQVVITGTYAGAPWVPVGPLLNVRFGALGELTLRFQSRPRA